MLGMMLSELRHDFSHGNCDLEEADISELGVFLCFWTELLFVNFESMKKILVYDRMSIIELWFWRKPKVGRFIILGLV